MRPSLNMVDLNYELWIWNWDWGIQLFILINGVLKVEKNHKCINEIKYRCED